MHVVGRIYFGGDVVLLMLPLVLSDYESCRAGLDRKVTMAEQIATIRYRMNAFMFWFMIFFCPC